MRKLFLFLFLVAFGVACTTFQPEFTPEPNQVLKGKASYVIDGDTFYFSYDKGKFKSKVMGAGSPGISDKNGYEAYEYLRALIHQKDVEIQYLRSDDQNRWVVNAKLNSGEDVAEKIRNHLATLPVLKQ
jgi:endonuclease YncB( thermonuclease family)